MHGTVSQKVGRVLAHLVTHPQYLSRCLSHNLLSHRSPLDLELPWFSYAAIDFLVTFLQPELRVFEYGSGGSTLFFARRVKSVYSVEDNFNWFELVSQRLEKKGLSNATLKLCPFDFKNPVGFEDSPYLNALGEGHFDVIVVDGSEEWTQVRPACFHHAERQIKKGGIIVVDDSWRYPGLREKNSARGYRVFESVGPGRPGVTSTDVFFY
jgi:predicted O-methyltransferase YrrM